MRILKNILLFFGILVIVTLTILYVLISKINSITIENNNQLTSVLILGKGGVGHTAPDLTDSIMLASVNSRDNKVNLLSLPRDIWVESTKAKLNSSYYWGKKNNNDGFGLVIDSVNEITGIKPQYVVVVDFSLFKDLVDSIGGIDINVENAFVDEKYPIAGLENDLCGGDKLFECRYETLTFPAGMQHMDGALALKFVRSRNSKSDEGTDIAREKRQQKVISAVKDKLLSRNVILNPKTIKTLYGIAISHIETNIDTQTIYGIARELYKSRNAINYLNIPENILRVSQGDKKYDKQYVFVPASGTWKELQEWIQEKI